MRHAFIATITALVIATISPAGICQGDNDYGARSWEFCSTRKAKKSGTGHGKGSGQHGASHGTGSSHGPDEAATPEASTVPARLGLGYTIYKRSAEGTPVRIDPRRPLVDGDQIRVVLESNADGYLYIFNTDSASSSVTMIYPQVRLRGGENFVEAHVPLEVPSRLEPNPSNQWLILKDGPLVDRLYFVVSEHPLPDVPTGDALRQFCGENRNCFWEPTAAQWAQVRTSGNGNPEVVASQSYGQRMTGGEAGAVQGRSVRLGPESPPPAAIAMGSSAQMSVVVVAVDLRHTAKT